MQCQAASRVKCWVLRSPSPPDRGVVGWRCAARLIEIGRGPRRPPGRRRARSALWRAGRSELACPAVEQRLIAVPSKLVLDPSRGSGATAVNPGRCSPAGSSEGARRCTPPSLAVSSRCINDQPRHRNPLKRPTPVDDTDRAGMVGTCVPEVLGDRQGDGERKAVAGRRESRSARPVAPRSRSEPEMQSQRWSLAKRVPPATAELLRLARFSRCRLDDE